MQLLATAAGGAAFAVLVAGLVMTPTLFFGEPVLGEAPPSDGHLAPHAGPELACTAGPEKVKRFDLRAEPATWTFTRGGEVDGWSYGGSIPGPVLCANVGDRIEVVLENALPVPVTFHTHLPELAPSAPVAPGAKGTFVFNATRAGAFLYHDLATGTEGTGRGLHGALLVREAAPDVDHEIVVILGEVQPGYFPDTYADTVNGRSFPIAPHYVFEQGERILVHLLNVGPAEEHTFHVHGHRWHDAEDGRVIDNKFLSPHTAVAHPTLPRVEGVVPMTHALASDNATFLLRAQDAGAWMYHCHVYDHINGGMTGMFAVVPKGGAHHG